MHNSPLFVQTRAIPSGRGARVKRNRSTSSLAALTLGAIGVVYGDIGTSPLYALKEVSPTATSR